MPARKETELRREDSVEACDDSMDERTGRTECARTTLKQRTSFPRKRESILISLKRKAASLRLFVGQKQKTARYAARANCTGASGTGCT
jgi:hypothetical protein